MTDAVMASSDGEVWRHSIKTVGVIGLGGVGRSICRRLSGQGHKFGFKKVAGFDLDKTAPDDASGAEIFPCKSIAHLVDMVDLVLLCLPSESAVGKIARSHEGLLDCVRQGQIIVDHGWSSLDLTRQLATAFAGRGAAFLDAPITRSLDADQMIGTGSLPLAIGGDEAAIAAVLPIFREFAGDMTRVGAVGTAQVVRQMGDLVAFQTFAALAEALTTARAFGIQGDQFFDALSHRHMKGDDAGHHRLAEVFGGDDTPADEATSIADAEGRLRAAIKLAKDKRVNPTGAESTLALLEKAIESGSGDQDLSGLFSLIEARPKTTPRSDPQHRQEQTRPSSR